MSVGIQTAASREALIDFDPASAVSLQGSSVLIVDEDPAFQLGLKTFLKEYVGFSQTFTARNGREALERLAEEPSISIITLDYKMPEIDGVQFLELLKEQLPRPLGVIMITGYPSEQLEETFRSFDSPTLRATEFIAKPVEFTELENIIHRTWDDVQAAIESQKQAATPVIEPPVDEIEERLVSEDTSSIIPVGFRDLMETRMTILEQKVDKLSRAVETVSDRTPSLPGRFFGGLIKLLLALVIFWAALHFGLFDRASDYIRSSSFYVSPQSTETPAEPAPSSAEDGAL